MKRHKIFILISILLSITLKTHSQGLKFNGNEALINERTSYNVFSYAKPSFKDSLNLKFSLLTEDTDQTGYIFRIKIKESNLIFNLAFDSFGDKVTYNLNEEGRSTLITISINKEEHKAGTWLPVRLSFDLINGTVDFRIKEKGNKCEVNLPNPLKPEIYFGKSDYFIDLPTFSIQNLNISSKNQNLYFPLREHQGNIIHDSENNPVGSVINPIWLINNAYYWQHEVTYKSKTVAGFNLDSRTQQIYYFNRDSLTTYDIVRKKSGVQKFQERSPMDPRLGYNFLNTINNSLYMYEVSAPLNGDITMASYDLANKKWNTISKDTLIRQMYHHGKFFDKKMNRMIIFGGFGHLHYNNDFYSYDLAANKWGKLKFTGDTIFPRYFLSVGHNEETNCLYIFGGMGNESGEYNVGRKYFYDLYKVDLEAMHVSKIWEIPWNEDLVVPVKSMIIDNEFFTTLCYPEHFSDSYLRLYRFSLTDGSYDILGDSIPIHSEKITTNADLFYNQELGKFYGIVQEFEDDDMASSLKVYTLSAPAVSRDKLFLSDRISEVSEYGNLLSIGIGILAVLVTGTVIGYSLFAKNKKNRLPLIGDQPQIDSSKSTNTEKANSIYLFGDFCIKDKEDRDISYTFSPRLKQALLIILQYSGNEGISSQEITNLLWPDRDDDKAKNIRGVTISNLRKLLNELDGVSLIYENSHYKILIEPSCYCDYIRCIELISKKEDQFNSREFIELISRGKFLKDEEDLTFDSLKSSVEQKVEPILKELIIDSFEKGDYKTSIKLSDAMFNIDSINELAITYIIRSLERLNMHRQAKKRFLAFVEEYKNMIGELYPKEYSELKE